VILTEPNARPIVAHRGASGEYPENTMLAFEKGLEMGADALEFDVRLSADGIPVVMHDPTVDRTTDGTGPVSGFSAEELANLDAGEGEGVPTVEQVVKTFNDVPCIIELKEAGAADRVGELLRRLEATKRVLLGSFLHRALKLCDRFQLCRSASRRETVWFWLRSRIGTTVGAGRYQALTIPERHRGLRVVDELLVSAATKSGIPVHVWTVDDRAEAERLRAMGIAGIITNRPDNMRGLNRS